MSSIAIIPARGGSKRIPRKNIRDFCGKPMIAYSIEAALTSALFSRVIVSTDDAEIAEVSKAHGAEAPFRRPANLSDDHATTSEVILHALRWLEEHQEMPDFLCCIYPTAPFLRQEYLREGFELVRTGKAVAAFSVTTYAYPIQRSLRINDEGLTEYMWPEYRETRSQDLPEAYHDAGQFYWYAAENFLGQEGILSGGFPVILPRYLVLDIDTPEDWIMAERIFKAMAQADA